MRPQSFSPRTGRTVLLLLALLVALFAGMAAILIHLRARQEESLRPESAAVEPSPKVKSELAVPDPDSPALPLEASATENERNALVVSSEAAEPEAFTGSFAGRVTCHRSGEALPEYAIEALVLHGEKNDLLSAVTDAEGRFVLEEIHEAASVRVELIADMATPGRSSSDYREQKFDPAGLPNGTHTMSALEEGNRGPFDFAVESGPTCFFAVDWPVGYTADDFVAQITNSRPRQTTAWTSGYIAGPLREPSPAQVLHPFLPWVRFPKIGGSSSAWVELRSKDSSLRGGVRINRTYGTVKEPLRIQLESATSLTGVLDMVSLDTDPDFAQDWCELRLRKVQPHDALHGAQAEVRGAHGEHGEPFLFEFLDPGEYVLSSHDAAWKPWSMRVTVAPGRNNIGRFELEPRPVVGPVQGRILSESGTYEGACHVTLHDVAFEHDAHYDHSLNWEEDENGQFYAEIEFENVRAGEWMLFVHCHDGFEWPLSLQTIRAPQDSVVIRLPDRRMDLQVEIVDADTGEPVDGSRFTWRIGQEQQRYAGPRVELRGLPYRPEGFSYWVEARGYQTLHGKGTDFTSIITSGGLTTVVEGQVLLKKGWGTRVYAFDQDSLGALPGVEIFMNGISRGATDEEGQLDVALDSAPKSLRGVKESWERLGDMAISIGDEMLQFPIHELRLPMRAVE